MARDATRHSIRRLLGTALAGALLSLALAPGARATAAVTITAPLGGTVTNERMPTFAGAAEQVGRSGHA